MPVDSEMARVGVAMGYPDPGGPGSSIPLPEPGSHPADAALALPPGARLASATPSTFRSDGEMLTFELELDTDVAVELAYE
jgi:hypothetical protein